MNTQPYPCKAPLPLPVARLCLLLMFLFLAIGLSGCRTKSFLSTQQEINLGQEGAQQIDRENRVDTTSPEAERVRRIGQSLLPHMADRRDVPYSFKVIEAG